jgi:hypothetical protein
LAHTNGIGRHRVDDAALYNLSHPDFGYQGDPLHPSLRRYHGFLVRAASY